MFPQKQSVILFFCITGIAIILNIISNVSKIDNQIHIGVAGFYASDKILSQRLGIVKNRYLSPDVNSQNHTIKNNHTIVVENGGSIKTAYDVASSGDTILIKEGTYKERLILKKDNLTVRGFTRRTATINGGFEIWGNHIKIESLNFTNDVVKIWPDRYTIFLRNGGNGAEIKDNYFFNIPGDAAISAEDNNTVADVIIKDNHVYNCTMGIDIYGRNWLVENNEVEKLHNYGYGDSDYSRFHGTGHVIRNNYFHGTDPSEIGKSHVDCFQTFRGSTSNILIEGNTCYDFHQGVMSEQRDSMDNTNNITVTKNVFANFKKGFIDHSHGIIVHESDHYIINNNTFINMGVRGILFKDDPNFPYSPDYETVRDNIFYQDGNPAYHFPKSSKGCVGGYNILFNSGELPDSSDIEEDPMFIDFTDLDFHPASNSIACGCSENGSYVGALPCK